MAKIIDFKNPELHRSFDVRRGPFCQHKHVVLDVPERIVECEACGAKLDPFDFLLHTAGEEANHFYNASNLKNKVTELSAIAERLKRDIVNLKGQKQRLEKVVGIST